MTAADFDWVTALDRKTPGSPHWSSRTYESLLHPQDAPAALHYFACIAEQEGARAGLAVARLLLDGVENACELEWIAVEDALRRKGVGRQLLRALESWARSLRAGCILLEVRAGNEPAQALYQAAGYRPAAIRRGYYTDPQEDAVRMVRSLAPVENLPEKSIEHGHREC